MTTEKGPSQRGQRVLEKGHSRRIWESHWDRWLSSADKLVRTERITPLNSRVGKGAIRVGVSWMKRTP